MSDGNNGNDFDDRTVLTWNVAQNRDAAFPTAAQEALLARTTGAAVVTGSANADYIRGTPTLEKRNGGTLRNRAVPLGDIVNSSPFYLKDTQMLYVGANDGMLHAINALNGRVMFSYVPAGIDFTKLASLSDPNYQHAFFVDGPVSVTTESASGDNYLVGTLGRGGKGVFALDVSDTSRPEALWDNTAAVDNDMGYVTGMPLLAKSNTGATVAIVGNGIDSTSGSAALYIYNVATGTRLAKFVVDTSGGNGMSAPRGADTNGDGRVDHVYAGDLKGNLWKFDLSASSSASWNVAFGGTPFFQSGTGQPITGGLAIAQEPSTRRLWITFGTGRLISTSDLGTTTTQSLYGLIDSGSAIAGRGALTTRTIAAVGTNAAGRSVRAFERYQTLPAGSRGWYIDLGVPTPGERVISGPRVRGRAAWYSSVIPDAGSGCEPGGTGYLNVLDLFTGTSPSGSGEGNSTSYFDFDADGSGDDETVPGGGGNLPIGSIDLGIGMPTESGQVDKVVLVCGSDGKCEDPPTTNTGGTPRRIGWREILRDN
jgi:type IV pilus assembly protein PilY1